MRPKLAGNWIESSLKSAIAALVLASASLAGAQALQTLVSFNGTNGVYANALTQGSDGNFYGTTMQGGSGDGTVFRMTANGALATLFYFSNTNGANPHAALTLGTDGNFYGTTSQGGGNHGPGEVFKMTPSGTLTRLYSFKNGGDGEHPEAALTLGADGNFYGTTVIGGSGGCGTVFRMTPNGTLTTLVAFYGANGEYPNTLTLGNDGNFYGTTESGGDGYGTVFRMAPNGAWTTLAYLGIGSSGGAPYAGLTLGNDSNFYGTTWGGGDGYGTVYRVTTNGTLTMLVYFHGTNGAMPIAGLALGNDGNFYGTTANGGSSDAGTVFSVTTSGTLTTLYSFTGGNDGAHPQAALTLGSDGNFYGTTEGGGIRNSKYPNGMGTVFRLVLPIDPPSIMAQPLCRQALLGGSASFSVSVSGTAPFHYQWRFNGTNLLSATDAVHAIQAVAATNTGNYSVIVTNSAGSVTSSNAVLTVIIPPTLALDFWAGYPLLDLWGMLSSNFVVQYSTNLMGSNWINLLSVTNLQSSPYQFLDSGGVRQPARFYRAVMQ